MSDVTVRLVESAEEREAVYRLRYQVYVEEMGYSQPHADHERHLLREPLDAHAHVHAAFDGDGRVVGTVRTNFGRETPDLGIYPAQFDMTRLPGEFHPAHTAVNTKLIIATEHRRGPLAARLTTAAYELCLLYGILFSFTQCRPSLVGLFRGFGYEKHKGRVHDPDLGEMQPLVLALADIDHLERIGSPFARSYRAVRERVAAGPRDDRAVASVVTGYDPRAHSIERLFADTE